MRGDAADDQLALAADVDQAGAGGTATASAARMIGVARMRMSPIESQLSNVDVDHVAVGGDGLAPFISHDDAEDDERTEHGGERAAGSR